jgi:hypothetical protein
MLVFSGLFMFLVTSVLSTAGVVFGLGFLVVAGSFLWLTCVVCVSFYAPFGVVSC